MTILTIGNVVIGDTNPFYKIHVYGGSSIGSAGIAVYGNSKNSAAVYGDTDSGTAVYGNSNTGTGVFGSSASGRAGDFSGRVVVLGNFSVANGTKNFLIDHPLDPANKYLIHAAIESAEVLNLYSGNVTTDEQGNAVVKLPDWFEALNRDFRYQLTVINTFAQAIIAEKIKDNHFVIKTNEPGVEVSWQVTGVRSDAVMFKHPFKVEEDKPEGERGTYLSPEAFGQPEEKGMMWARHPELMREMKERRERAQKEKARPNP